MQRRKRPRQLCLTLSMSLLTLCGHSAFAAGVMAGPASNAKEESHPGMLQEVEYSEAVFEFTNKRYLEAVKILDGLLKMKPDHIQGLELKALALKSVGNDTASIDVYRKLLKYKPKNERAPYHFELGTILYKQKKFEEAKPHLRQSIQGKFNVGISHFFLGTMDFQSKEWKSALHNYRAAIPDVPDELKVACHYYLGMVHAQRGYGPGATHELLVTRSAAARMQDNDMARDLGVAAGKMLEPYDKSVWYGSVSLSQQYDGNVSNVSSSVAPEDATGKVSLKSNLAFMGGYMGSPMSLVQTIAMYRLTYNKNFNSDARDYEFATNTLSGYFTLDPLMTTNYGLKLEGNYGFQNRQDSATRTYSFRPYSYSGEGGPFMKTELSESAHLAVELNYRIQKYTNDGTGVNERSGSVIVPRTSLRLDSSWRQLNPTVSATYEINQARGADQRSRTFTLDVSNPFKLPANHSLNLGVTLGLTGYPDRSPETRSDKTISFRLGWQKPLTAKLALNGDATYSSNSSSVPSVYSYTKPAVSLGLTYSL